MHITLNGTIIETNTTALTDFLGSQDIDLSKKGIAIAINDSVVLHTSWNETVLTDGDVVEVVRPFQGG